MIFYEYPPCSTCKKARQHLESKGVSFEAINLKVDPPSVDALKLMLERSGYPLKRFFNTSGQSYKALGLKDRFEALSEEEALTLLSEDGMLIKRPILIHQDTVILGYKQEDYDTLLETIE